VERVRKMLEKGADPNAKDKDRWTPLHRATFEGHVEVVRVLLEHRADQTVKNILRKTPLEVARAWGHGEVVSVIEEWLRRGKRPPQQREAAETRPSGEASQKAVPLSTAQPPPTQPPPPHSALVVSSPPPVDVDWWSISRGRPCGTRRFLSLAPPSMCWSLGCLAACS
jgi:hypothetical protein